MDTNRAISMEVSDDGNEAEIAIIANSDSDQSVEYHIEISGQSRAIHKGRTYLSADSPQTLSRFKMSYSNDWCAQLSVKEQMQTEYILLAGNCEQADSASR